MKSGDPRLSLSREIPPGAAGGGIFDGFFGSNYRPEIDSGIISGMIIDPASMKATVKFGDSR